MRKRYTHTNPTEPLRIRNRFSHRDLINVAATSSQGSLRPILQLPEENDDIDNMDFQYNDDDNMDMVQYHEDEDDYNDVEDEEDSENEEEDSENEEEDSENEEEDSESEEDGDYNDVEDKDSDDDIENDSEVSEDDNNGGNDDHEQDDREEHHQIIDKALDKDNMPTYDGEFAPYFQKFPYSAGFKNIIFRQMHTKILSTLLRNQNLMGIML